MGVGIAERGNDASALCINHLVGTDWGIAHIAIVSNLPIFRKQKCVLHGAEFAHLLAPQRQVRFAFWALKNSAQDADVFD